MMNCIMRSGAAALALAASALFALPAAADSPAAQARVTTRVAGTSALFVQVGFDGRDYRPVTYSARGSAPAYRMNETDRLGRKAIQICRSSIQREARRRGYRDVDFDSRAWAQQIGPAGYKVRFREVEFEGRRHDVERSVSCTVRQGRVSDIDGLPHYGAGPRAYVPREHRR